ncbi:helicase SEN1 [Rhizoctonia solani 123E]|uniref:Helicase SEN1 n=1 Tax=Rhizoctonia solani 123E TaxID=1423351 RepID=A0A074RW37_9AGAM|nr:helicase SEN1 [Rhizoctonia solani 123E]
MDSEKAVLAVLNDAQTGQIRNDSASDQNMGKVWFYLKGLKLKHWYCREASETVRESAIFLQRLHAYNSDAVKEWKDILTGIMHGCCECVQAYEVSKQRSREVYLPAFGEEMLNNFFHAVNKWEEDIIVQKLKEIGLPPEDIQDLNLLPEAVLFHLFANPALCVESSLLGPMVTRHSGKDVVGLSGKIPPIGLLVLSANQDERLREWSKNQLKSSKTNVPLVEFKSYYSPTLETFLSYLGHLEPGRLSSPFSTITHGSSLWGDITHIMKIFPSDLLVNGLSGKVVVNAFRRTVKWSEDVEELHTGALRFIGCCLGLFASEIWASTPANYPDTIFKTITKNGRLARLVCSDNAAKENSQDSLSWIQDLLLAIWARPQSRGLLDSILAYLVGLMSNSSLTNRARTVAMDILRDGFLMLQKMPKVGPSYNVQLITLKDSILRHKTSLVKAAFQHLVPTLRDSARLLLEAIFQHDLAELDQLRFGLTEARAKALKKVDFVDMLKEPVVFSPLWKEANEQVDPTDRSSVGFLMRIMARSAHIDVPVHGSLDFGPDREIKETVFRLRTFLKSTLLDCRTGFDALMARFALVCEPDQLDDDMMSSVITLLFSPVPKLHGAALEMFSDCDGRKACIRFALKSRPQATLRGVTAFVEAFNQTARKLTEACSAAKSLVRCFVDVIEGLCGPEQDLSAGAKAEGDELDEESVTVGLLNDPLFDDAVRPMLKSLWSNMCKALTLIISMCPSWAEFFNPQDMVDWMRDALIFGRLMRAHVSSFQSSSMSQVPSPSKTGLETMRTVQDELVAWFRLTDAELIYQAYELMMSFLEGGLCPSPSYREKLARRLDRTDTDLPKPRMEAMKVALDRLTPPAEKRKEPTKPGDSRRQAPPAKSARIDNMLVISDDETPSANKPRHAPTKQSALDILMQKNSSTGSSKPSKSSAATSKIHISTIKSAQPKAPAKPKGSSGNSAMAKLRAEAVARQQQTAAQKADIQRRNLSKNIKASGLRSSSPPQASSSRLPSPPSSRNGVDSDSSSSDDEEEKPSLAVLAPTVTTKKLEQPKRTMVVLDGPPVISAQQKRLQELKRQHDELQRRTARLKPNLEGLHEQILRWSIDHDGPQPLSIGGAVPKPTRVVPKFNSKKQYFDIFHPLLVNECWSQILQSKEEGLKDPVMCLVMTRSYVDNFIDLAFNIVETMPERWYLAETDIVLLRSMEGDRSILAKITGFKRGNMANQIATGTMRLSMAAEQRVKVQIQEKWKMCKIYSLSTINREYAALTTAEYYDLIDEVMSATSARPNPPSQLRIQETMRAHRLNEPQAKAISASLSTRGFSLIQGPPGTGKTSTICGLAGSFVSTVKAALAASGDKEKDKRRLLICAPSNAAIDEVTKRLANGVRDNNGQPLTLKVVRVGTESSMNVSVTANSLDSLVDEKMAAMPKTTNTGTTDVTTLRKELSDIKQKIDAKRTELDNTQPGQRRIALENEFRALKTQRTTITSKLDTARDQQKNASRVLDAARRKFRHEVLTEADVICSTLSGAGHDVLVPFEFETVVIDEAAQAIEIATLIPLRYGCKTCILVGDPQQLPPTVISQLASGLDYNQSLFVRLQKQNPDSVHLLSIQYRMHPTISAVPSRLFYNGRLQDGPDMDQRTRQVWHASSLFGPYQFFDVAQGREEAQSNHSQINRGEADAAIALYSRLTREFKTTNFEYRIGIVSMYRGQVAHMKSRFAAVYGQAILKSIDFNTVDGFQGQEKDIIILSCVRAGTNVQSVGFLADERRMNVALTRSRSSLFILGHAATLERCNATWKTIVEDARTRGCILKYSQDMVQSAPMHKANVVQAAPKKKPEPKIVTDVKLEAKSEPALPSPNMSGLSLSDTEHTGPGTTPIVAPGPVIKPKAVVLPAAIVSPVAPVALIRDAGARSLAHPLPAKPAPAESSVASSSNTLPPRPQAARAPPPRKKAAISAFIPKPQQKGNRLMRTCINYLGFRLVTAR